MKKSVVIIIVVVIILLLIIATVIAIWASSSSTPSDSGSSEVVPVASDNGSSTAAPSAPSAPVTPAALSGIVGRYVTLKRTDGKANYLNIAEIQIFDPSGNKYTPTGASLSTDYDAANYPAAKLIDGNLNNFAHTQSTADAWMKVDLGSDKTIGKIIVNNRADCCQDRVIGSTVIVTKSDGTQTYSSSQITSASGSYSIPPSSSTPTYTYVNIGTGI
jgi:hypothetical protein